MNAKSSLSLESRVTLLARPGFAGTAARASLLGGLLLLLFVLVASVGFALSGSSGVLAAMFAALVCLVSGLLAMVAAEIARQFHQRLASVLLAMGIRTSLPMAVLVAVYLRGGAIVDTGMAFYLLVFYLAVLAIETYLDVTLLRLAGGSEVGA